MPGYIEFSEIGVTIACLTGAFGFIVLTWNVIKAIKEWIASLREPTDKRISKDEATLQDHEERITHLEECCSEVRGKLQSDWEFQQDEIEMNRLMLKSIKQLLKHDIDGNDTEGLKMMEDEIDNYLVEHAR